MREQKMVRPQPVGVFPFPVGLLLLPETKVPAGEALQSLMRADHPTALPAEWTFYDLALRGKTEQAAAAALQEDSLLGIYNAFVLTGDASLRNALREASSEMAVLVMLAEYAHGTVDALPAEDQMTQLDGELLALARMIQATHLLELGELHLAHELLLQAAASVRSISPVFAAQLYGQAAQSVAGRAALPLYRQATALLETCKDVRLRAETWIAHGQCCQEISSSRPVPDRTLLVEATKAYQRALAAGVSLEQHSDLYALAQNNLGLAYLAMPMDGDGARLRTAVAVQSFREALKIYDREETPEAWISTQLNLANALQYMHSAHPEENLARAVEIYEELLEARPRGMDPLGHARLLANQANALAHLGIFAPALVKATEAHKLLHWHDEAALAQSMLELTDAINRQLASTSNSSAVTAGEVAL